MKLQHREKGYTINVLSRRGKPVVSNKGFVMLTGRSRYRHFNTIAESVLDGKFEVVA